MKFLFVLVAFSASMIASTMAGIGLPNIGYGAAIDAPVGYLQSQRILPTQSVGYGAPAIGYGAPAVNYGAPAIGYGAPAVNYGAPSLGYSVGKIGYVNDAQVQSLAKLALSLPTPAPDTVNCGRGYGSSCAAPY